MAPSSKTFTDASDETASVFVQVSDVSHEPPGLLIWPSRVAVSARKTPYRRSVSAGQQRLPRCRRGSGANPAALIHLAIRRLQVDIMSIIGAKTSGVGSFVG